MSKANPELTQEMEKIMAEMEEVKNFEGKIPWWCSEKTMQELKDEAKKRMRVLEMRLAELKLKEGDYL